MEHKRFLYILILMFEITIAQAQNDGGWHPSFQPSVIIGYSKGLGFTYGIDLEVGLFERNIANALPVKYGLAFSYYMINYQKESVHRISTINLMLDSDYANIRIGQGRVSNVYGYKNRVREHNFGYTFDVSASTGNKYFPWFGYKYFKTYNNNNWFWHSGPYKAYYGTFKGREFVPDLTNNTFGNQ